MSEAADVLVGCIVGLVTAFGAGQAWACFRRRRGDQKYQRPREVFSDRRRSATRLESERLALEYFVLTDHFVTGCCTECGGRPAFLIVRGRVVPLCPPCAAFRIDTLREHGVELAAWVVALREEARALTGRRLGTETRARRMTWDGGWPPPTRDG